MLLTLFLFVVFAATAGLLWLHGLWGNVLNFINILLAALVATVFYEPVTKLALDQMPTFSYVLDFLILWALFALTYGLLRLMTDLIAKRRLKFHPQVELIGRSIMAIIVAYVMVMFTCFSLHLSPLPASPMGGWQSPGDSSFLGLSPDKQWLSFVRGQSKMGLRGKSVFDENGSFIPRHAARRKALEGEESFRT